MYDFFFFVQIAALLVCIILYHKLGNPYKYFAPFLLLISTYELGNILGWFKINQSNIWSFNIYASFEFIFYSLLLYSLLKNKRHKSILFFALIITLLITVIYNVLFTTFNSFNPYSYILQSFIIITTCCKYFYYKIKNLQDEIPITSQPNFWLNTGLLFYYLGSFLFFASFSYISTLENSKYLILYRIVINVSNITLYFCLIKLFLCFKQTKT